MNKIMVAGAVVAAAWIGCAAEPETEQTGWNYEAGNGISYNETPIMTAEFTLGFDSRYMTYGVIDGKDPIVVPGVTGTFFDWFYIGVESIFDVTKGNGKGFEYGNRAGRYTTLDAFVGLAHSFDLGDTLGALDVDVGYLYEYMPRSLRENWETQYVYAEASLGDLWFEPKVAFERDIMLDEGTYVNVEVGHTIELTETLSLRPAVAQGFGNSLRTKGYFGALEEFEGFDHGGLMDTSLRVDLEYALTDWLTLGAYVAYYDYWLDGNMRDAARAYNAQWGRACDHSWNFVGGLSVTATF